MKAWGKGRFYLAAVLLAALSGAAAAQQGLYTFDGDSAGDRFGVSVSGAGDVNGDGYDDLIAGAPGDDNNGISSGSARVFSGKNGSVLYTFDGDSVGDGLGYSVSGGVDVNNDGFADLIAGIPFDDNNGGASGCVRIYSGKDGIILYSFDGDPLHDTLGWSVSGAGDVNADGFDDLIAGSQDGNYARVFSGKDGSIRYTFKGDGANDRLGHSVSGAGDVDNDGFDDLIAGAPQDSNNGTHSGSARVFSGNNGSILYTFDGDSQDDELGYSVSDAGDVDGDGFDDVIAGAYEDDNNGKNSGSARVFSGKDGATLYSFDGDSAGDRLGHSVSGTGDVDSDGYDDVIAGAPNDDKNATSSGNVTIYSGKDGSIIRTFVGDSADDELGFSVSGAGDVDGDGLADLIAGAHQDDNKGLDSGSARVYSDTVESITVYGTGCAGTGGLTPSLTMSGAALPGGNLLMSVASAKPWSFAALFGGVNESAMPCGCGCTLNLFPIVFQLPLGIDGSGSFAYTFPLNPSTPLGTVKLQAFVADNATVCGYSNTNGVSVTIK